MTTQAAIEGPKTYQGNCHCGAVRFACTVNLGKGANRCNCSICTRTAVLGGITKPDAFTLLSGEQQLTAYEWGAKISKRYFCKTCGVHCFARGYLAEVGGDYVSINYNCLEGVELDAIKAVYWDGRHDNWDAGPRDTPWPRL